MSMITCITIFINLCTRHKQYICFIKYVCCKYIFHFAILYGTKMKTASGKHSKISHVSLSCLAAVKRVIIKTIDTYQ